MSLRSRVAVGRFQDDDGSQLGRECQQQGAQASGLFSFVSFLPCLSQRSFILSARGNPGVAPWLSTAVYPCEKFFNGSSSCKSRAYFDHSSFQYRPRGNYSYACATLLLYCCCCCTHRCGAAALSPLLERCCLRASCSRLRSHASLLRVFTIFSSSLP